MTEREALWKLRICRLRSKRAKFILWILISTNDWVQYWIRYTQEYANKTENMLDKILEEIKEN